MDSAAATALPPCYRISPRDDVAIALRDLAAGERVALDGSLIELADAVPRGHKFALRAVGAGKPIRKYGQVIDFDAGRMLTGDPQVLAEDFMRLIVDVASGRAARNELNEEREIAIWKDGVTL